MYDFFAYPHPSGGLRLRVNPGNLYTGTSDPVWVAQQDTSTLTGPVANPRIDVAVLDNTTGAVSWVAGSEGASPAIPAVGLDKTPLWAVYLRVSTTSIDRFGYNAGTNSYIYRDMRPGKYRPVPPLRFPGEISPASFGANQDNYNPTGLAAASVLRLTATGASRDITGIAGGSLGRVLVLMNIGSQNIVLKDASTSSTAANRFEFPSGDVTILPEGVALVEYDNTSQRWRLASASSLAPSGSAGGDLSGTYPNPTVAQASAAFAFTGDLTPASFAAQQDNYAPTGHATAGVFRLEATGASRDVTGLAGGADGRIVFLTNIGSQNIVLKDESASSTAGNRFALTADITMTPDTLVVLLYDSTTQRWRAVAGGGGSGGVLAADFDAKGDLLVGSANDAYDNLPVGTNGKVLEADSTQTLGVKWGSKEGGATAFFFHDDDLTASGSSVAMNRPGDTGLTEVVMPYAGSIVAVSVRCQNARTAGTATFKPTVNGTESSTLSAVLNGTDTQSAYGTQAAGVDTFTAGQRVGVKVTTDGSWAAGATPSVDVEVWIVPAVTPPTGQTMTLIEDKVFASDAASYTFSSIPGTYKHLLLLWQAASDQAGVQSLFLRFNGDTGSNYDYAVGQVSGGAASFNETLAAAQMRLGNITGTNTTNGAGAGRIEIPNYAGTSFLKGATAQSTSSNLASFADMISSHFAGRWRSTAAITSITVLVTTGNIKQNSRFSLYGIS